MKRYLLILLIFVQSYVCASDTIQEIVQRIKKDPLGEYIKINQMQDFDDNKIPLQNYCMFSYIKQNSSLFKNSLVKLDTKYWIDILPFDENNYCVEYGGREGTMSFKNFGLIRADQTREVQFFSLINNSFITPKLYPVRCSSNPKKRVIYGEKREDGFPNSTGNLLIYEQKNGMFEEITDTLLKKITESTIKKNKTTDLSDELKFLGTNLEDIISDDPLLYVTTVGKKCQLSIHCGHKGNKLFDLSEVSQKWKDYRKVKSHTLQDDFNRVYVIKCDHNFGLLFYDYQKNKFFQIEIDDIWERGIGKEIKNAWIFDAIDHIASIKIIDNKSLDITKFNGQEIKVKINYVGSTDFLNGGFEIKKYKQDASKEVNTSAGRKIIKQENKNIFKINDYFGLTANNENFSLNYHDNNLGIEESFVIHENELLDDLDLTWFNERKDRKYYLKQINENVCQMCVASSDVVIYSLYYLNFIFQKQRLIDEFNRKIKEEEEERIKIFSYTYDQYRRAGTEIKESKNIIELRQRELQRKVRENLYYHKKLIEKEKSENRKKWLVGGAIIGIPLILLILSKWRQYLKKNQKN